MNILVFNCGSSSLTFKVFEARDSDHVKEIASGKAHRVGVKGQEESFIESVYDGRTEKKVLPIKDHKQAAGSILREVKEKGLRIDYIGHRFVHGGMEFNETAFMDKNNLDKLKKCIPLAPIHNPTSLSVIHEAVSFFPDVPQYVAFDSAFHSGIPEQAYSYALPERVVKEFGFRKYGFHGLSYSYVTKEAARFLGKTSEGLRIVACHLGTGGASVAAIRNGRSVDTSMGYSPLPGLVMSTRCGDIDPMLTIYMMVMYGYRPDDLMDILNKESGLLGVSEFSSDIRDILHSISEEQDQAGLAFKMYIHRLKKYIGSYVAVLGGIDVLVFTDDIGVHNRQVRESVCRDMEWAGVVLSAEKNCGVVDEATCEISEDGSSVNILTVPTEEELVICLEGLKMIEEEK